MRRDRGLAATKLARELRFAATQLALWLGLYAAYLLTRSFTIANVEEATAHAARLIHLEDALGVLHEASVQDAVASVYALRVFFDLYYMLAFGPLLFCGMIWLGLRHRAAYRELRTAMLVSLGVASVFFVLFPVAPPRLVEGLGIVDTVGLADHDSGSFAGIHFNPYAAMPSIHVGWSLLFALVGLRVFTGRLRRLLLALHPVLMVIAVTTTGNHYFVDALAGSAVAVLGYALVYRVPARRLLRERTA